MLVAVVMLVVVVMGMRMAVLVGRLVLPLLLAVDEDADLRPGDAGRLGSLGAHLDAGQPHRVHRAEEALLVVEQLIQRAHEHIARRAHGAFKIQCFHAVAPLLP